MRIPSKAVHRGRNADMSAWKDDRYVSCWNCGYTAHLDREGVTPKGVWDGDGYARSSTQVDGAISAADTSMTVDSTTGFAAPATGSITAFANNGRGTLVTSAAHGLTDKVTITGTTNYNGTFFIQDALTNTFVIPTVPYVADDATGTWTVKEHILIYDQGSYATSEDVSSTWTDATDAPRVDKVSYTGVTGTTFTGCKSLSRSAAGMHAHDDDMFVKQNKVSRGCPLCGCLHFDIK